MRVIHLSDLRTCGVAFYATRSRFGRSPGLPSRLRASARESSVSCTASCRPLAQRAGELIVDPAVFSASGPSKESLTPLIDELLPADFSDFALPSRDVYAPHRPLDTNLAAAGPAGEGRHDRLVLQALFQRADLAGVASWLEEKEEHARRRRLARGRGRISTRLHRGSRAGHVGPVLRATSRAGATTCRHRRKAGSSICPMHRIPIRPRMRRM